MVRAAADGTIQSVNADTQSPGRFSLRLDHIVGQARYATDYTNVTDLASGVSVGATVTRGQVLGAAGVQTQFIGTSQVTWGMTHFQVNDFSKNEGLTNPNAVSPEAHLSAGGQTVFETLWRLAAYQTEWCEPFPTNARAAGFPMSRTWTRLSGSLPERLDVRCPSSDSNEYEYTLRSADGTTVEVGVLKVDASVKPFPTVDARASSGTTRVGTYNILGGSLEINLGPPGGSRPSSPSGGSAYTTPR